MVRIPKLRFPEFKGEWEWKRLGEITKINQGLQIPISQRFLEPSSDRKFYITNEFIKNRSKGYYIENPPQSVCCDENDILMTRTGNTGQVVSGVVGAFHNNFFKVKYCHNEICKDFLFEFLRSYKTQVEILKLAGTSTIPDLNHKDFYRIGISIPLLSEQQKIASFLLKIDERLDLLRKKYTTLQRYKKGVMQQIFSQQIRFKQDDGSDFPEWVFKSAKKVANIRMGFTPSTKDEEMWGNCYRWVSISDMKNNGKYISYTKKGITNKAITNRRILKPGTLVMSFKLTIGRLAILREFMYTNEAICNFEWKDDSIVTEYMYYYLSSLDVSSFGSRAAKGITLNLELLNSISLKIPHKSEQQKIATFLSNLDQQLEALNQQIKENERYKKGLLQQMFVS